MKLEVRKKDCLIGVGENQFFTPLLGDISIVCICCSLSLSGRVGSGRPHASSMQLWFSLFQWISSLEVCSSCPSSLPSPFLLHVDGTDKSLSLHTTALSTVFTKPRPSRRPPGGHITASLQPLPLLLSRSCLSISGTPLAMSFLRMGRLSRCSGILPPGLHTSLLHIFPDFTKMSLQRGLPLDCFSVDKYAHAHTHSFANTFCIHVLLLPSVCLPVPLGYKCHRTDTFSVCSRDSSHTQEALNKVIVKLTFFRGSSLPVPILVRSEGLDQKG